MSQRLGGLDLSPGRVRSARPGVTAQHLERDGRFAEGGRYRLASDVWQGINFLYLLSAAYTMPSKKTCSRSFLYFKGSHSIEAAFNYDFEGLSPQTPLTDLERNMSSVDTITGQTPRWKPDTLVQSHRVALSFLNSVHTFSSQQLSRWSMKSLNPFLSTNMT